MKPVIGFAPLGHLGSHSAAAAKAKGFTVSSKINECDIVYICPDRPSEISPKEAVDLVLPHLQSTAILVVLCQVTPGFTRKVEWHNVYYQVETLRMKDAEHRAVYPDRIIIGHCGEGFLDVYLQQFLLSFSCPLFLMSYESAELAKIAINVYLAAQVCTTNTLAEVAKKIGANWKDIIPALQSDPRIGYEAYLEPGFGLSKHLIRDLETIQQYNINTKVTDTFLEHSEYRRKQQQT